jgi:hypothetical protein
MLDAVYDGAAEIERAWRDGLTPDPLLTVSEWSDRHRMLSSKASAEPGRWRTRRTPYLKEIMDCLSPTSPVERVVFMKGAQVGAPLDVETPVPTPAGWRRMGHLDPGDQVFDEQGRPWRVAKRLRYFLEGEPTAVSVVPHVFLRVSRPLCGTARPARRAGLASGIDGKGIQPSFSAGVWLVPQDDHHPRHSETISHHAEAGGEEGLRQRHGHLAAVRQGGETRRCLRLVCDGERKLEALEAGLGPAASPPASSI